MVNMCKHKGRSPKRYIVRSEWKVSLWDCLHIYGRRWRAQFLQHGLAQGTGADGKYCGVTRKGNKVCSCSGMFGGNQIY